MQDTLTRYQAKTIVVLMMTICCTISLIAYRVPLLQNGVMSFPTYFGRKSPIGDIHVAIVCANRPFNEMAITTIKSIMFHHRKSYNLTFHIFTDVDGEELIGSYFRSIKTSCTNLCIYPLEKLLAVARKFLERHYLTIGHYSGIYAFSKALIHEVLPADMHRVLVVDTDVIFVDDVHSLWKQFELFQRSKTALGLVPWYPPVPVGYVYKGSNPDPFVAGVVLLDLSICRLINFTHLMDEVTQMAYHQFGLRSLWTADQVILGLFGTYHAEHFVTLPCFVNGHTSHYLTNGPSWKSSCAREYPRNLHVVPSGNLLKRSDYFGSWYVVFKDMPVEWLSYCNMEES